MPQGMVQLSPETEQMVTWDPCSGYDYNKDVIYGFTHTHLSGTGCTDLIDVSLMPMTWRPTPDRLKAGDFGQHYSHDTESARPGYYQVLLTEKRANFEHNVNVELSATVRTGIRRLEVCPQVTIRPLCAVVDDATPRSLQRSSRLTVSLLIVGA